MCFFNKKGFRTNGYCKHIHVHSSLSILRYNFHGVNCIDHCKMDQYGEVTQQNSSIDTLGLCQKDLNVVVTEYIYMLLPVVTYVR